MTTVSSVASAPLVAPAGSTAPVSVATALATLKLRPGSTVAISDTLANIQKNLDTLQGLAARITGLDTTDATPRLSVTAAQYAKDGAILARWGATDGHTVDVTGVLAGNAAAFAAACAGWVASYTVSDSAANLARHLDSLQSLAGDGSLRQIVATGTAAPLRISAAQLAADGDALALIKNQAYTLSITDASVSDTLGLDGQAALTANARVKAIAIRDTTAAIEDHLDALQRVGLKLKSIAQSDTGDALTLTASQLAKDSVVVGKILTPYQLEVLNASAAQVAKLAANRKVQSITVADTAANIARRWSLLDRLSDSLAAVEVTDADNAVRITADQLALGGHLLGKFATDAGHGYSLAVTGVRAGQAATVAAMDHVAAVSVSDSADNVAANLDDLIAADAQGRLEAVNVVGKKLVVTMDAARLLGDAAGATQGVIDKIANRNVGVAVTGASLAAIDDLAAQSRVVSIGFSATSDEIEAHLDGLAQLGRRLGEIEQTDGGTALDLTQSQFDSRAAVLAKVGGGYRVNVTGASAGKALLDALNSHVASVSVADSGRNLVNQWSALRSIGSTLAGIEKTDAGALTLSATGYLLGQNDGLVAKFSADQRFAVTGASVAQAQEIGGDAAVEQIDVVDDGSVVTSHLDDLAALAGSGKLHSLVLNATTTRLSLHASQLDAAQPVLDLIKDGHYSLAVDQVDAADLGGLLAGNAKIATVKVQGDAQSIVAHLGELSAAGSKLGSISRTDDTNTALELTGAAFAAHRATLGKISGGYQAALSEVAAAQAGSLATLAQVRTMDVSDSAANLAAAWSTLATLGGKLGAVAQTDSSLIALSAAQWSTTQALGAKFSTPLGLSIANAGVGDLAALAADDAVREVQVSDSAAAVSDAWSDLAAEAKLTRLSLTDPGNALTLSAASYGSAGDLLGRLSGSYSVALSEVAVADAAGLQADSHVSALDVLGSAGDIAAGFDTLAGLDKLGAITLSDDNGTLTLSAAQVLGGSATLGRITNGFQIAATGAALADLPALQDVSELSSIAVTDTAAHVADQLDDLVALGGTLAGIHLSDDSPVLALTQQDWTGASATLAKIDNAWQADLSEVDPASVETLAADATVRQLAVAGTAGAVAQQWSALVAAYGEGSGKLTALAFTDEAPLVLTEQQQADGAALIAALLPDQTILTA